jgi:oxygen-dependent protoporphyrinogen oxidase
VVVGGGIAGLSAARALHVQGLSFVLLEAAPRWGGVIRTERADGFLLEGGPDTLLAAKPEGVELCAALGLGDRLVPTHPTRNAVFVVRRGGWLS